MIQTLLPIHDFIEGYEETVTFLDAKIFSLFLSNLLSYEPSTMLYHEFSAATSQSPKELHSKRQEIIADVEEYAKWVLTCRIESLENGTDIFFIDQTDTQMVELVDEDSLFSIFSFVEFFYLESIRVYFRQKLMEKMGAG